MLIAGRLAFGRKLFGRRWLAGGLGRDTCSSRLIIVLRTAGIGPFGLLCHQDLRSGPLSPYLLSRGKNHPVFSSDRSIRPMVAACASRPAAISLKRSAAARPLHCAL